MLTCQSSNEMTGEQEKYILVNGKEMTIKQLISTI